MISKKDIIRSLVSAVLLILSFPPFDFYPIAWIALVPLLMSVWEKKANTSFSLGLLTGSVFFAGTTYWIFNSVYFYGNIPSVMSLLIVAFLCLYLGLYIGVFSVLFNYLCRHSRFPSLFIVPVLWVTLEFLRTYALTGFPWSALGYTQYKVLPVIQMADITGVYGVSFLVASFNGAVFDVIVYWPERLKRMPLFERWPMAVGLVVLTLCIISAVLYGVRRIHSPESGDKFLTSVIQGNFEQEKKWDINFMREIMDTYKELTSRGSADSPILVVWPESAVPFVFEQDKQLTGEIIDFQKKLDSYLLFGSVTAKERKDDTSGFSNSTVLLSPEGEVLSFYDKIHLVPYGEYIPLRKIFPFIKKLTAGIGDFIPGRDYTVMETPFAKISSPICFEIIFPGLVRKFVNNGANLIVTVTNDAWFGRSSAPYQHFSMSVLRAVENRVPVVRAANTGISGFIDMKGRIMKRTGIFERVILTEKLSAGNFQKSFYTRYGDLFAFLCIISSVLLIANNIYPKK
jgi:apolipoprotein N-acyltransferase